MADSNLTEFPEQDDYCAACRHLECVCNTSAFKAGVSLAADTVKQMAVNNNCRVQWDYCIGEATKQIRKIIR